MSIEYMPPSCNLRACAAPPVGLAGSGSSHNSSTTSVSLSAACGRSSAPHSSSSRTTCSLLSRLASSSSMPTSISNASESPPSTTPLSGSGAFESKKYASSKKQTSPGLQRYSPVPGMVPHPEQRCWISRTVKLWYKSRQGAWHRGSHVEP